MATLDDLGFQSISEMSTDEAIEELRQIRLRRRIPDKVFRTTSKPKVSKSKGEIDASLAAELLKMLEVMK